jgi:hypothetical protein
MNAKPLDKPERDALFRDLVAAQQSYDAARQQRDSAACTQHFAEVTRLRNRYFERLPRVCMAVCPHCGKPLYRTFDPFGFDGLWWSDAPNWPEPPACPHFVLLRGAVGFNARPAKAGPNRVFTGPEAPYVIPRLLELDGMLMVIGSLEMQPGHTAYPLTYFAPKRPPASELTSVWARPTFEYRNASGDGGWDYANDPWDFDLRTWIERSRVRWAAPGSANAKLCGLPAETADDCPYLNLPGERQQIELLGDVRREAGLPDGQPSFPID